mgnify:CR=1 FL=1
MTKKGIQLTLNFLVTIIIAVVVFSFGVRFVYNLVSEVSELETLTTDNLDKRIEDILCESADKVCIGVNKKVIPIGEFGVFGIKVINVVDQTEFQIEINPGDGINKQGASVPNNKIKFKYNTEAFELKKNEERNLGLGFEVPKDDVMSGTYIFNVEVKYASRGRSGDHYDTNNPIYKIYVEVP